MAPFMIRLRFNYLKFRTIFILFVMSIIVASLCSKYSSMYAGDRYNEFHMDTLIVFILFTSSTVIFVYCCMSIMLNMFLLTGPSVDQKAALAVYRFFRMSWLLARETKNYYERKMQELGQRAYFDERNP